MRGSRAGRLRRVGIAVAPAVTAIPARGCGARPPSPALPGQRRWWIHAPRSAPDRRNPCQGEGRSGRRLGNQGASIGAMTIEGDRPFAARGRVEPAKQEVGVGHARLRPTLAVADRGQASNRRSAGRPSAARSRDRCGRWKSSAGDLARKCFVVLGRMQQKLAIPPVFSLMLSPLRSISTQAKSFDSRRMVEKAVRSRAVAASSAMEISRLQRIYSVTGSNASSWTMAIVPSAEPEP
jgi:hypothetical protein